MYHTDILSAVFGVKIKIAGRGRDIIKSSSAKSRPDSQTELNISVLVLIIISIILRCFNKCRC
jgi:hypothetical protein